MWLTTDSAGQRFAFADGSRPASLVLSSLANEVGPAAQVHSIDARDESSSNRATPIRNVAFRVQWQEPTRAGVASSDRASSTDANAYDANATGSRQDAAEPTIGARGATGQLTKPRANSFSNLSWPSQPVGAPITGPPARYPLQPSAARATPTTTAASSPPSSAQQAPQTPVVRITAEEQLVLSSLPPMCTSDLPGITNQAASPRPSNYPNGTYQESVRALATAAQHSRTFTETQPIGSTYPTQVNRLNPEQFESRVEQASANFKWPDESDAKVAELIDANLNSTFERSNGSYQSVAADDRFAALTTAAGMPNPHANAAGPAAAATDTGADPHLEIYSRDAFPSAKECATCHKQIYEEWASSSHAYAAISPMFHSFEDKINRLAQGTLGYFCLRCHAPVATTMGLRRDQPIWDGPRVFREGVTCVACHRVKIPFTKVDGERRMEPGDIYAPIYGAGDGNGVDLATKYRDFFKTKIDRNDKSPAQPIHRRSIQFEELSESTFCMSCHQVAVKPGIKLEVVWDQYRASPACKDGVSCQDCHMGKVPGVDAGYSIGPAAVVNDRVVNAERKHSNHMFYGPGYSIAHPGIFPDNLDADRWTVNQWLEFDWRAGWGTDEFEDPIADGQVVWHFPETWREADDRYEAREIIDVNLKKLEYKRDIRRQVLENGSQVDGPFFAEPPRVGKPLRFRYCITNTNPGHNMPSGSLGAQPQIWMNAVLIGPDGQRLWETGYLDSNGDLADNHSLDVLARRVPLDTQLMNLQTKFLTTNVKGTDREMYLPINIDIDQLPFLRPAPQPVTVINHPPLIRMEGHSIPALGSRNAKYSVPARLIQQPGVYRLSVRMRSRAEPIYFMRFCDATPEMERMMNEWIADFHTSTVTFEVH